MLCQPPVTEGAHRRCAIALLAPPAACLPPSCPCPSIKVGPFFSIPCSSHLHLSSLAHHAPAPHCPTLPISHHHHPVFLAPVLTRSSSSSHIPTQKKRRGWWLKRSYVCGPTLAIVCVTTLLSALLNNACVGQRLPMQSNPLVRPVAICL